MPLAVGTRLGPYEIVEPIGKGGMGEVYRARDARLEREVAIKVLPDELAGDEARVARFEREAKLLASLNHPNIASIHGFEDSDRAKALVLELVEGPTLAQRIVEGPIPIEESVAIAKQIAEALEAGHEAGIIHRDLKPANIKLKEDGTVKVLDYGLAKALEGEPPTDTSSELSQSPTLTRQGTEIGVILGTAAYMSPEQAKGKRMDRRTDIWAFGAVLFEMLTGMKAFPGETVSDVLAAVLRAERDWSALPNETPSAVGRLLRRCTRKEASRRLPSMGAAALELEEAFDEPRPSLVTARTNRDGKTLLAAVALMGLLMTLGWAFRSRLADSESGVIRFTIAPPRGQSLHDSSAFIATLSPDGRALVYQARTQATRLYVRRLDQTEAEPLDGTVNAFWPFFSPDGRWVGFGTSGLELKKMSLDGTPPQSLVEDRLFTGASWGDDGSIFFAQGGLDSGLYVVDASGTDERQLVAARDGEHITNPIALPGAAAVLFMSLEGGINGTRRIAAYSRGSGEVKTVLEGSRRQDYARFDYSPSGHLVVGAASHLTAIPFDPRSLSTTGPAATLAERVEATLNGSMQFALSRRGDLVKRVGGGSSAFQLVSVTRSNEVRPITESLRGYHRPRISPDGSRIAVSVTSSDTGRNIWLYDTDAGTMAPFTFDEAVETSPAWAPDGSKLAFASSRAGFMNPFWRDADGRGEVARLTALDRALAPNAFTPDGRYLLAATVNFDARDLWSVDVGTGEASALFETPENERQPTVSADGQWLAYVSDESGRDEVFIRAFPSLDGKRQVSIEGASEPVWSKSGKELFFRNGTRLMSVIVESEPRVQVSAPALILEGDFNLDHANDHPNYDVSLDGREFIMVRRDASVRDGIEVVLNWSSTLEQLAPSGK